MFRTLLAPLFFFVCIVIFAFPSSFVEAQSRAGIGIRPAVIENGAEPGEVQEHVVGITNLSESVQTYYLYKRDIVSVDGGGAPIFADEGAEKTGFELTEWLTLDREELTLNPGEEQEVKLTLAIPGNATPGSHFGGVFVSMEPPRLRSTGAAVGYEVANIISIRVAGDAVESAQIRSFSTDNFFYGKPVVDFRARIENKGTVLVRPVGPLEINNMFGQRVAMLTFNESKAGVFPLSEREFVINWEHDGPAFGRYEAVLSLLYGEQGRQSTISSTATFWVLPMNIFLPALGALAFLLLVTYIIARMYVRRTLHSMGASGTRRMVRRKRKGGMSAVLLVIVVMLAVTALFLIVLLALFA